MLQMLDFQTRLTLMMGHGAYKLYYESNFTDPNGPGPFVFPCIVRSYVYILEHDAKIPIKSAMAVRARALDIEIGSRKEERERPLKWLHFPVETLRGI